MAEGRDGKGYRRLLERPGRLTYGVQRPLQAGSRPVRGRMERQRPGRLPQGSEPRPMAQLEEERDSCGPVPRLLQFHPAGDVVHSGVLSESSCALSTQTQIWALD